MIKPILFNTDMVQAILDNRKCATRRAVKGYIPRGALWGYTAFTPEGCISCRGIFTNGYGEEFFRLPYRPGDILYVRETWAFIPCIGCNGEYARDMQPCQDFYAVEYDDGDSISDGCFVYRADCKTPERIVWRPSIHMPSAAARIWLKVTDVRVERLQSMGLDDFINEGVVIRPEAYNDPGNAYGQARRQFVGTWDHTIKKADLDIYGWAADPFVWAVGFERCEKPESEG